MLIHDVEVSDERTNVRVTDQYITEISTQISPEEGERCFDGQACALLPGLHDHHIHLNATAAAMQSLKCGPPEILCLDDLVRALHSASGEDWIRGIGYHQSVAGEIDRQWLDEFGPNRPIRIQHRGGRMWVFNSEAIDLLKINIPTSGRLVDGDSKIRQSWGGQKPNLEPLVQRLHSYGITGVTEVTPGNEQLDLKSYVQEAQPLNLSIMGRQDLHDVDAEYQRFVGALKIHNHDNHLPSLEELTGTIANAHDNNRPVAIHCVTRAEIMLSLAAIEDAGVHPMDRIEHAAIADEMIIEWIGRLGLTVVTQPHFIRERQAAYIEDVDPQDLPDLWRLRSFLDRKVKLAAGSDSPFGSLNPWAAMDSAVDRPTELTPEEGISPEAALTLFTKPANSAGSAPRQIEVGAKADLCLIDMPWAEARRNLADVNVQATWIAGDLVYDNTSSIRPQSKAV